MLTKNTVSLPKISLGFNTLKHMKIFQEVIYEVHPKNLFIGRIIFEGASYRTSDLWKKILEIATLKIQVITKNQFDNIDGE